jgi:hypothetical protein
VPAAGLRRSLVLVLLVLVLLLWLLLLLLLLLLVLYILLLLLLQGGRGRHSIVGGLLSIGTELPLVACSCPRCRRSARGGCNGSHFAFCSGTAHAS